MITHAPYILLPSEWDENIDGTLAVELNSFNSSRSDSILNLIKMNDIALEPTFSVFFYLLNRLGNDPLRNQLEKTCIQIIKRAKDRGIPIIAGTDVNLPLSPDEKPALLNEIKYFVELIEMTPYEALASATYAGARAIGIEKTHGSIEKKKIADLVVLKEDPTNDIFNLSTIIMVIKNGKIVKHLE